MPRRDIRDKQRQYKGTPQQKQRHKMPTQQAVHQNGAPTQRQRQRQKRKRPFRPTTNNKKHADGGGTVGQPFSYLPEVDDVVLLACNEVRVEHHVAVAAVELTVLFLQQSGEATEATAVAGRGQGVAKRG